MKEDLEDYIYGVVQKVSLLYLVMECILMYCLVDNTSEYTPSQDTTGSLFVPHHRYNLRDLPSRRLSTDTSTLNLSALSSNSTLRLLRQHAQPLSSETNSSDFIPSVVFYIWF